MIEKLSVAVYVIFKVLGLSLCNIEGKVGAVAFNNLPTWLMATLRLLNSTEAGLRNGEVETLIVERRCFWRCDPNDVLLRTGARASSINS